MDHETRAARGRGTEEEVAAGEAATLALANEHAVALRAALVRTGCEQDVALHGPHHDLRDLAGVGSAAEVRPSIRLAQAKRDLFHGEETTQGTSGTRRGFRVDVTRA